MAGRWDKPRIKEYQELLDTIKDHLNTLDIKETGEPVFYILGFEETYCLCAEEGADIRFVLADIIEAETKRIEEEKGVSHDGMLG